MSPDTCDVDAYKLLENDMAAIGRATFSAFEVLRDSLMRNRVLKWIAVWGLEHPTARADRFLQICAKIHPKAVLTQDPDLTRLLGISEMHLYSVKQNCGEWVPDHQNWQLRTANIFQACCCFCSPGACHALRSHSSRKMEHVELPFSQAWFGR